VRMMRFMFDSVAEYGSLAPSYPGIAAMCLAQN
jgi:hypothetical protein